MKKELKLYRENIKYIENSFKYDINNGVIEGTKLELNASRELLLDIENSIIL